MVPGEGAGRQCWGMFGVAQSRYHRPMIELCIPSALDPGLAPRGCHVVSLFTQYTPYELAGGRPWDEQARNAYADTGT